VHELSNTNPKVRRLAASQLQATHYADTSDAVDVTHAIEHALSIEEDPLTRVSLATSLAGLHDPEGIKHLQTMCIDASMPIRVLISAAQSLQIFKASNAGCIDVLLDDLTNDRDKDYRDTTITLFPALYRQSTPQQAARIVTTIESLLADRNEGPSVRIRAGEALAAIGSPSSADVLAEAISQEQNPVLKASLERNLHALEKKP